MRTLFLQSGFLDLCGKWRQSVSRDLSVLLDVYDCKMWLEFMTVAGLPFLADKIV